jgi:GAF domain-containing protein
MRIIMREQFGSLEEAYQEAVGKVGVRLFTISAIADSGTTMARVYSTHPAVYPVGGKKSFTGDTSPIWFKQVIEGQQPFLGPDKEALRTFFFDHETIEALGCGAIVNVPVVADGETIGSINFLDAEGRYDDESTRVAVEIAQRSVDAIEGAISQFSMVEGQKP